MPIKIWFGSRMPQHIYYIQITQKELEDQPYLLSNWFFVNDSFVK